MGVEAAQGLVKITQATNTLELLWQSQLSWMLIAQQHSHSLFSNVQNAFQDFTKSGQVWTLLIGFILGYLFRSLTAY